MATSSRLCSGCETISNHNGFQSPNLGFLDGGGEGTHDGKHKGNKQQTYDMTNMKEEAKKVTVN